MVLRTPSLNLPYLRTDNRLGDVFQELLHGVDALTQASVVTRTLSTPPGSPSQGALYIVKATGTDAWAGHDNNFAVYWGSSWVFYAPTEGWQAWLQDENIFVYWDGAAWSSVTVAITDGSITFVKLADSAVVTSAETIAANNNDTTIPTSAAVVGYIAAQPFALTTGTLAQFAATTSNQLAGVISDETGSGALVFANSPTLISPDLGTPNSGTLTNCTGLPIATGVSGLGTGVATLLATPSSANLAAALTDETGSGAAVFATSPTLVTPVLGTPSSGTLTNCTGLPVSTGISGLGTGVAAWLATPSSANLATALTDETGSGALVFATSPTLVTPLLGTPTSGTLTNCTGLPISTGVAGLGTGIATFLATPSSANLAAALTDETGSGAAVFATSPTLVTPLLGTPTSGTLTNCTGLPISTGVSGLAAGVATFLATPSSANLITAVTDETGSGALVFGTSPSLTTPSLDGEVFSVAATVTAGTNAQGQGALTKDLNVITTAANNPSGVTLPTATTGRRLAVINKGANAINVYPASGGTIDALAANASIQIPVSGVMLFDASSTTQWYSTGNMTFTAPTLGTPASGTLTNCTGLPVSTGISGLGTGVATWLATPSSANLAAALTDETGSGAAVFATSPTLVTPVLGTPTSGTLTNCTGLPISTGVSGLGAGVATFLATPSSANLASALTDETGSGAAVFATSPALVTPLLGTPTSGTLTNCTGLPISTGVSGLGSNVATMLATFSSANIATACTDETGSGALVFGTSPSLATPSLDGEVFSVSATVTAGTNAQGQGALTKDFNVVTTTTANPSGVTLPTATTGRRVVVINKGTNPINVYPASGAAIDALAANASIQIPVAGIMRFDASSTTQWYSTANSTFVTPVLGTPASGTLTNCTGLPVSTGISGLGTGVATWLATPSSANLASALTDETGSGALVFATSPTLVTPILGTPTSGTLTNCTGLPISTGVSGLGTGVATFLATPSSANLAAALTDETGSGAAVFATSPTLVTPLLGTPTSGTLTNCTGLPISTGVSGLGAGVATMLATFSSANIATACSDETGSGALVFATSPTLVTPILGTPTSGTLTNCTGLPISTGVSGLGTGVATFLATPSSANLSSAITDETGSGALVFGTSPSLTTPSIDAEVFSVAAAVTAGTNAQAQGALTKDYNVITTASNNPSGVTLPTATTGRRIRVVNKGANPINVYPASGGTIDALAANASIQIPVAGYMTFDASSTTQWYSSANATFTLPVLGTPVSGTLTNCTGLPISTGVSGLGTGVATFLATPSSANLASAVTDETGSGALVFATSPTLVTPLLGTPTSGTLTNCTGLPISTGVSGLGTGVATMLATFSSANIATACTDETGSGALVFATSPTLVTPVLGTPSSGTLTNCTGLPTAGLVANAVTNAKLAQMATQTFKGRTTAGTGDPEDLTATQATAILNAYVGDSGSGGTKGLVPAPATGDATKFLKGNGTWAAVPGGGDALTTNPLSQFAATTSAQLAGVISDETGSGALVFATSPTLVTPLLGTPTSGTLTNCTGLPISGLVSSTSTALGLGSIELGHASDTTIARSGAGDITIEGNAVYRAGGTDVAIADGGTASSTYGGAQTNLGIGMMTPGGRLTLSTGTPVMTSSVSGATTVYYTPYVSQWVPIYDGTSWKMVDTGGELSQATTDTTKSPAATSASNAYDVFVWNDSGTMRATRGPSWSSGTGGSTTVRGTGAGGTELQQINGIWTNKNSITNGPAANRGTYVGTIFTNGSNQVDYVPTASGTTTGCLTKIYVWNMYNRVMVGILSKDTTASHTYNSNTIRARNNNTGNARLSFVSGMAEDNFWVSNAMTAAGTATSRARIGWALDSETTYHNSTGFTNGGGTTATNLAFSAGVISAPQLGFHYISANESVETNLQTCTFFDNDGGIELLWRC